MQKNKLLFFVTEDRYFCSHRLPLAVAAMREGYEVTVVTRVRQHGDLISRNGLKLVPFEMDRTGFNPFREIVSLARLVRLYRLIRPDIVHQVALKPVIYGTIAARLSGVNRIVNALAGLGWVYGNGGKIRSLIRNVLGRVLPIVLSKGYCIVQNKDDAELLAKIGVPSKNLVCIPGSGVDMELLKPVPEPPGTPIVVFASRILWEKGVGEFIEVARKFKAEGAKVKFILAGSPDTANPSHVSSAQLDSWKKEGVVDVKGWVTDIAQLFSNSHIICLPTYYREGVPKVLIEAAAMGRPTVTTDVPGCREVVRDGVSGYLVTPKNVDELQKALRVLINDANLRNIMGYQARKIAEKDYSLSLVVKLTLNVYAARI